LTLKPIQHFSIIVKFGR